MKTNKNESHYNGGGGGKSFHSCLTVSRFHSIYPLLYMCMYIIIAFCTQTRIFNKITYNPEHFTNVL